MNKICAKRAFPVENEIRERHHWTLHIRISRGTKFQLKLIILTCWIKFVQKSISDLKQKKRTPPLISAYSRVKVSSFTLNGQFWLYGPNLAKNWISSQNQKKWTAPLIFLYSNRQFSHVTKSRIFKNLNLRKKANRNFRGTFLKSHFRHLKLYSNPLSWLARSRWHMGTFWKSKDSSSHFWESQAFRFLYVEVQRQRRLKSTKAGISS